MTLYNKKGKAVAYMENDVIWTFDGRAIAYLFQDAVYSFPGKQLGWFEKGWLRDMEGYDTAFYSPIRPSQDLQDHLWKQPLQSMRKRPFRPKVPGK